MAMTGHLGRTEHVSGESRARGRSLMDLDQRRREAAYLQYVACIQLSQLEKALAASVALSFTSLRSRGASDSSRLSAIDPHTPPRRLLAMATSTDGIAADGCCPAKDRGWVSLRRGVKRKERND